MTDIAQLQAGRKAMAEKCMAVALTNTPPGVIVQYRKSLSGWADHTEPPRMSAPRPVTRKALYIYLHECAHFHLGHDKRIKPRHVEEMEAEKWAHAKMREAGIPVPRAMTKRAKNYVAWKIKQAIRRGAKQIDKRALAFSKQARPKILQDST